MWCSIVLHLLSTSRLGVFIRSFIRSCIKVHLKAQQYTFSLSRGAQDSK